MIRSVFTALMTVIAVALLAATAQAAEIAVIVNKNNTNDISREMIERIYKAEMAAWPNGGATVIYDLSDSSDVRSAFTQQLFGKSVSAIKALWSVKLFSGKATPPRVLNSDDEMKGAVANNRNAIGYVNASSADGSVKTVLTLK